MTTQSKAHPYIRAVVDYGGIAAFAAAFFFRLRFVVASNALGWSLAMGGHGPRDLTAATWWLVIGSAVSLLIGLVLERRVAPLPLIAGGFALVFGTLTLVLHDPRIIKVKPTATNLVFAAALFGGLALRRNPLKWLLGDALALPDEAWRTLTIRYGMFFLSMAALNEVIWRTQSDAVWVSFKVFGFTVLAVLFSFTQVPLMMKYMHTHEPPPPPTE
ncbi:MAG TPA: inner membrane-spanning protein YciB [Caulobacteraceae bacterium]|jgi:intracellular septation protein